MFIVDPNINRLNILMIPWIYYTAVGTAEFTGRFRRGLPIAALCLPLPSLLLLVSTSLTMHRN